VHVLLIVPSIKKTSLFSYSTNLFIKFKIKLKNAHTIAVTEFWPSLSCQLKKNGCSPCFIVIMIVGNVIFIMIVIITNKYYWCRHELIKQNVENSFFYTICSISVTDVFEKFDTDNTTLRHFSVFCFRHQI
jgi:hypothetical protein